MPENAPLTRKLMRSADVSTDPPDVTAFCRATLSKTSFTRACLSPSATCWNPKWVFSPVCGMANNPFAAGP